ncbi:hypothetical protein GPECTOR_15g447 [Gonium pectorale]|uniref:Phytocyanin domain-containing protein n=1 Tax=Gonium pectorale TaxID=33097 RepID=A0A150GLW7_GONPE|nr:hypothetical protein GPECTOR_15g447 [Gonium pectorale]|eukprot:KXZ50762.1 hypothetical protein GPECTOR_15g447 [Gonium pectorale]
MLPSTHSPRRASTPAAAAAALLLLLLTGSAAAETFTSSSTSSGGGPTQVTLGWGPQPNGYPSLTVPCGGALRFTWQSTEQLPHNVEQIASADCNAPIIRTIAGTSPSGDATVTFPKAGEYYYKCSVPGHCPSGKMLLTVRVNEPCA